MNDPVCLGLSLQELSKISIYGFLYDYIKPKHGEKAKIKYQLQHGMKSSNYLIHHIFMRHSRLFWIYLKKHGEKTDTPWTRIFFSKIENRMIFNIKRCDIISNF